MLATCEEGDEVIIPNYTMVASANSVQMFGAKPIFVDVERETLCLDIVKTRDALTSKTKAVMLVSEINMIQVLFIKLIWKQVKLKM